MTSELLRRPWLRQAALLAVASFGGLLPIVHATESSAVVQPAPPPARTAVIAIGLDAPQLGPDNLVDVTAVTAGFKHDLALRSDGTVVGWGQGAAAVVPLGLTDVVAVAAGVNHSLALKRDGTVVGWGSNIRAAAVPASLTDVVAISAGSGSIAVKRDGTVVSWGQVNSSTAPTGLTNVAAVDAGDQTGLAVRTDGTVASWDYAGPGSAPTPSPEALVPAGVTGIVGVAAAGQVSVAVRRTGTVSAWGRGVATANAFANWRNIVAVSLGYAQQLGLRSDGSVVAAPTAFEGDELPPGLTNVVQVSASKWSAHALLLSTSLTPTTPAGLTVAFTGSSTASVSWRAPHFVGIGGLTSYQLRVNSGPPIAIQAAQQIYRVSGIEPYKGVQISVAAANYFGVGPPAVHYAQYFNVRLFRPSNGVWYGRASAPRIAFGASGDIPVPADYDGDGLGDVAVFRPSSGVWYVRGGSAIAFGRRGDVPVPADYDGDGRADIAVYRPSTATWFVRGSQPLHFNERTGIPVVADYDDRGAARRVQFGVSTGDWHGLRQEGTNRSVNLGPASHQQGDAIPVPGDYNGDGRAEAAVFRPSTGTWIISGRPPTRFGQRGDTPLPGDYNVDGTLDLAVFRPSTGTWYIRNDRNIPFGAAGDIPLGPGNGAAPLSWS